MTQDPYRALQARQSYQSQAKSDRELSSRTTGITPGAPLLSRKSADQSRLQSKSAKKYSFHGGQGKTALSDAQGSVQGLIYSTQAQKPSTRGTKILSRITLLPLLIIILVMGLVSKGGDIFDYARQTAFFTDTFGREAHAQDPENLDAATDMMTGEEPLSAQSDQGMNAMTVEQEGQSDTATQSEETELSAQAREVAAVLQTMDFSEFNPLQREIMERLAARQRQVEQEEQQLIQREAIIRVAEQRLEEKAAELEALRASIADALGQGQAENEEQITRLVSIYESMRPGDAASIFNGLEMDILLQVVQRMREQKSAPIIANMEPDRARALTAELANRGLLPELEQQVEILNVQQN